MSAATSSRSCATWSRSRIALTRERKRKDVQARAEQAAEERVLDALVGAGAEPADARKRSARSCAPASSTTRRSRSRCRPAAAACRCSKSPACRARRWAPSIIGDIFGKLGGGRTKTRRVTVQESHDILVNEESDKLLDNEQLVQEAIKAVEQNGIVFLDEIDKIAGARGPRRRRRVARGRAARPAAADRRHHGHRPSTAPVKTDHILFIASGAFHISKPSDLLPELQGRLPIRVELKRADARRLRAAS